MKKRNLILTLISVVIIGFGIYYLINNEGKGGGEVKELTIGYPHLRIALPVIVAYQNGYFEEQGLNVKLKSYLTAQPMMNAIVTGKIDLGGFCALPITFGAMARSNKELLFLGGMYENDNNPISVLIVKDTANIKKIADLKGKKIGILPTRAYEVWIQDILKSNGLSSKDVIISYVKPNLQADALNGGTVDALFTNDPAATITISKKYGVQFTNEALVPKVTGMKPFYFGSFNVSKEFADNNPEIIKKVATALDKAFDYIKNNQDKAKLLMAEKDPKRNETYLPKQFAPFVKNFPNSNFKSINDVKENDLEIIKEYYLNKKILPKNISIKGLQYKN